MEDEVLNPNTDTSDEGRAPAPAGTVTPPADPDDDGGTPPANDDDGETGRDGGAAPGEEPGDDDDDGAPRKRTPEEKMRRRIDTLTARSKGYEERIAEMQKRLDAYEGERNEREMADLRGLPVVPESLSESERKEVKTLRAQLSEQERARDFWARHGEGDDDVTVGGRSYTPEQCRRFARMTDRDAGRIEGRIDGILDAGRRRLAALMKKHGDELFAPESAGDDTPPRIPRAATAPKPPAKTPPRAPERAPGTSRAPASAPGAPPKNPAAALATMSQADFEREFEDI